MHQDLWNGGQLRAQKEEIIYLTQKQQKEETLDSKVTKSDSWTPKVLLVGDHQPFTTPTSSFRSESGISRGHCTQNLHHPQDCNCDVQDEICGGVRGLWGSIWGFLSLFRRRSHMVLACGAESFPNA